MDDATARPLLMALCAVLRDVYGDSVHDVLVAEAGRRVGLHDPSTDGGTVGGMSNNDKPGHPDCHECGGTGTNASGLPCFACHRKANLAARRHPVSDSVVLVNASGSKYAAFVEAIADGDLPGGLLATTGQPGPYSAAAVDATVDHLRQRIRELEVGRDAFRDSALAAESILRRGSDALARILGRDEGLPLALHLPTVRLIVAGLQEAQRELDDLRNLNESMRVCAESSTSIAERYTDRYKELHDAARAVVDAFNSGCGYLYECDDDCDALATRFEQYSGLNYCDGHAPPGDDTKVVEFDHAQAWRRLCALVKP